MVLRAAFVILGALGVCSDKSFSRPREISLQPGPQMWSWEPLFWFWDPWGPPPNRQTGAQMWFCKPWWWSWKLPALLDCGPHPARYWFFCSRSNRKPGFYPRLQPGPAFVVPETGRKRGFELWFRPVPGLVVLQKGRSSWVYYVISLLFHFLPRSACALHCSTPGLQRYTVLLPA